MERYQVFVLVNAEVLPNVAKNVGAIVLDLEVARHVVSGIFALAIQEVGIASHILVKAVVVDFDLRVGFEVIGHQQPWRRDVHQLADGVIHAPHEHRDQWLLGTEQFPLGNEQLLAPDPSQRTPLLGFGSLCCHLALSRLELISSNPNLPISTIVSVASGGAEKTEMKDPR